MESYLGYNPSNHHISWKTLNNITLHESYSNYKFQYESNFPQVDHLTRKPKDGERSLREILSVLHENDISPFEITQSGLVSSLLTYLTKVRSRTLCTGCYICSCTWLGWLRFCMFHHVA